MHFRQVIHHYLFPPIESVVRRTVLVIIAVSIGVAVDNVSAQSCCKLRGNVDCDPDNTIDIADLTRLIDRLFISFAPLCCDSAANVDGDSNGTIDIADLTRLIDNLFISFVPIVPCGSGALSSAQRDSMFRFTGQYFDSLRRTLTKIEAAQATVAYLKTLPSIEDAGAADDGNCWARFIDDRMMIFVNNYDVPDSVTPAILTPQQKQPERQSVSAVRANTGQFELPASRTAIASEAMGSMFLNTGGQVSVWWTASGYDSQNWCDVIQLQNRIKDVGIFFAHGHGGYCEAQGGGTEYGMWTCETQSDVGDSLYADDLNAHRLVYMHAKYDKDTAGNDIDEWHYAYTRHFVRQYMTFAKNSLVFVQGCSTSKDAIFVNSFLAQGASAVAGFSNTLETDYGRQAVLVFFDRVLGGNWLNDNQESPQQRPFDRQRVYSWMVAHNYDYGDAAGTTRLTITQGDDDPPLGPLAPSIATMFVHPYDEKLVLYGMFGSDPGIDGKVTVGGSQLAIEGWGYSSFAQMDSIVCNIPNDGAGSAGNVQVTVRQIKSNETPLSRYKGKFRYIHETGDGRRYEVDLDLQFRVHLAGFRTAPGEAPYYNEPTYVVHADMASKGSDSCTGFTPVGKGWVSWSGTNSDLHNNIDGTGNEKSFISGAWFDPEHFKVQVYISGGIKDGIIQTFDDGQGHQTSSNLPIIYGLDTLDGSRANFPSYVEISLTPDYSISAGSRNATFVAQSFSVLGYKLDKVKIEWDNITCEFPPTDQTPRAATAPSTTSASAEK